jgi:protein-S-isoprenylcysteine O-methyltransferase Ste14
MTKTTTPKLTPSPTGVKKQFQKSQNTGEDINPTREFLAASLNMSWKLAIVVMVPVVGGFKLDQKLGWAPTLTITGFVLAMAGTALVLWQVSQQASQIQVPPRKKGTK